MEKYLKNLSIANIILTALFFLGMSGAASAQGTNTPQFIIVTLTVVVNALLIVVPISYVVVTVIITLSLVKRYLNSQNRLAKKKFDKLPILWFALSSFSFIGYFLFINMLTNSL